MIQAHTCPNCGHKGQIFIPFSDHYSEIGTVVKCPICKEEEDISYLVRSPVSIEELERKEYERLKAKYGG